MTRLICGFMRIAFGWGVLFGFILILSLSQMAEAKSCRIHIASMNVENMIDPVLDRGYPGTTEFTPVDWRHHFDVPGVAGSPSSPPFDWNPRKFKMKLDQLKRLVATMTNRPHLASVIELNNANVAAKVQQALGFDDFRLTNSTGHRGMDVALMHRFDPNMQLLYSYEVAFGGIEFEQHRTRNILVSVFLLGERYKLHVITVHWPSQASGAQGNEMRADAAFQVRNLAAKILSDRRQEDYGPNFVMVMGDFNTLEDEHNLRGEHPFRDILTLRHGPMTMVDLYYAPNMVRAASEPPGSYFYSKTEDWNKLDRIFVSANMFDPKSPVRVVANSFSILASPEISMPYTKRDGSETQIPAAYNFWANTPVSAGFSDHYPVGVTLEIDLPTPVRLTRKLEFELDTELLNIESVTLFSTKSTSKKYISLQEFHKNEEAIRNGTWGTGIWEFREEESMAAFEIQPDLNSGGLKNELFDRLRNQSRRKDQGALWGPRWDKLKEALSDFDSARAVVIKTDRPIPAEWVYQVFLFLWEHGEIKYLPTLDNIHTAFVEP